MNAQIAAVDPTATICLRRTVLIQLWISLSVRSITLVFQGYNKALRLDVQWTTAQKDVNIGKKYIKSVTYEMFSITPTDLYF
jgi:hypothetical protein